MIKIYVAFVNCPFNNVQEMSLVKLASKLIAVYDEKHVVRHKFSAMETRYNKYNSYNYNVDNPKTVPQVVRVKKPVNYDYEPYVHVKRDS